MKKSRRTFTAEFKAKVAIEAIKEIQTDSVSKSVSGVAIRKGLLI